MAETNYLNFFRILIHRKRQNERIAFEEFYDHFNPKKNLDDRAVFKIIVERYIESFNGAFYKSKNKKRALTAKEGLIKFKCAGRIIHGFLEGGITDAFFEKYNITNNQNNEDTVNADNVLSQPSYFLIWLPQDTNVGLVMIQSNDSISRGIISAFFEHLKMFFSDFGFVLTHSGYTPKPISDEYYTDSHVISVEVIQLKNSEKLSDREGEVKTLRIAHTIKGFSIKSGTFKDRYCNDQLRQDITNILGLRDPGPDDQVKISVSDGRTTKTATIEQENFVVRVVINTSVEKSVEGIENMYNFVEHYLRIAKNEINGVNN